MWLVYLIAVVLGGGSLLIQLVAGDHGPGDAGDVDHPSGPGLLSTRALVYGLFTFGFVGGLLHVFAIVGAWTAFAVGVGSALATGAAVALTLKNLDDPSASGAAGYDEARGRRARVLVGCAPGQRGKVRVSLKGHEVDMLATTDEPSVAAGAEVVIVDVRDGVAHVAAAGKGMA